jgi:hypothetical protein
MRVSMPLRALLVIRYDYGWAVFIYTIPIVTMPSFVCHVGSNGESAHPAHRPDMHNYVAFCE